ncbi:MAG: Na+/H+ antiporter NhaC [Spirochaetia bacterium]|nr:Na+/H+ antiporter NhaC [Spirochaetia bacterium]
MKKQDLKTLVILFCGILYVCTGLTVWKCGSSTVLATAALLLGTLDVLFAGISYRQLMQCVEKAIAGMIPAVLILLCVGMMVGCWMASGTIPYLMYLGFRFLRPDIFLPVVCLLCTVMSVVAGTSWGTMATIGIAAMTVSEGLGVPAYLTASAVVVGAFFGDTLSPMSDSTVIVCSVTKVPLLQGIRQSMLSTVPAYIISMIYYIIRGKALLENSIGSTLFDEMFLTLENTFSLSALLLLPLLAVIVLLIMKKPVMPVFICGTAAGILLAVLVQGQSFSSVLEILNSGYNADTSSELLDKMLSRGGFSSMYSTLGLLIAAAAFSGTLQAAGVTDIVLKIAMRFASGPRTMQLYVLFVHGIFFMITGAYYVSYPLVGSTCRDLFDKYRVDRRVLSRLLLDTGTGISPLIGWSTTGAYTAATLGVSALAFGPHAIMCWLTVIFSILLILTGVGILKGSDPDAGKSEEVVDL